MVCNTSTHRFKSGLRLRKRLQIQKDPKSFFCVLIFFVMTKPAFGQAKARKIDIRIVSRVETRQQEGLCQASGDGWFFSFRPPRMKTTAMKRAAAEMMVMPR